MCFMYCCMPLPSVLSTPFVKQLVSGFWCGLLCADLETFQQFCYFLDDSKITIYKSPLGKSHMIMKIPTSTKW